MRDTWQPVLLPDNPAPHLTEWLFDIGPSVPAGYGEAAIGWRDLAAWQDVTGVELEPWEARTIRTLSRDFVAARYDARKPDCPPPYAGKKAEIAARRQDVGAKVQAMFRGLTRQATNSLKSIGGSQ